MQYNSVPERVESDKNMSPLSPHNTVTIKQMTDNPTNNPTNFDGIGEYTYPQVDLNNFPTRNISESEMRPKYDVNTNSFNTITRQVISKTEDINQNYIKNDLPSDNYITHQGM